MKKQWFLYFGIALIAIVGLACGGGSEPEPTTAPTSTPSPTATTPAVVEPTPTSPPMVETPSAPTGDGVSLSLGSVNSDDLVFGTESLMAVTGSTVTVTYTNNAITQQHNWVLVQNGTKDDVALAGASAPTTDWLQPDDPNVIASIRLLNPGESGQVTFTTPAAGTYQFVCTFPGHNATMHGTFEVTP